MESFNKSFGTLFISLELLLGIILGFVYIQFIWTNDNDDLFGKTIADGVIRVYGALSLIFFFSVFLIGIIGAIKLKRVNKIRKAISYSIIFWLLSLIVSVLLAKFGAIPSLYVLLVGIVAGFNLGLGYSSQENNEDSGIST